MNEWNVCLCIKNQKRVDSIKRNNYLINVICIWIVFNFVAKKVGNGFMNLNFF